MQSINQSQISSAMHFMVFLLPCSSVFLATISPFSSIYSLNIIYWIISFFLCIELDFFSMFVLFTCSVYSVIRTINLLFATLIQSDEPCDTELLLQIALVWAFGWLGGKPILLDRKRDNVRYILCQWIGHKKSILLTHKKHNKKRLSCVYDTAIHLYKGTNFLLSLNYIFMVLHLTV